MYYPEIEKLFGTPLNEVPRPVLPFIDSRTKKAVVAIGLGLAAYGLYSIIKKVKKYLEEKKNKEKK